MGEWLYRVGQRICCNNSNNIENNKPSGAPSPPNPCGAQRSPKVRKLHRIRPVFELSYNFLQDMIEQGTL